MNSQFTHDFASRPAPFIAFSDRIRMLPIVSIPLAETPAKVGRPSSELILDELRRVLVTRHVVAVELRSPFPWGEERPLAPEQR